MLSFLSVWSKLLTSKQHLMQDFHISFPTFSSENILKIFTGAKWKQQLFPYRTNWRHISRLIRGTHRRNHNAGFDSPPINSPGNPVLSSLHPETWHFRTPLNRSPSFPPVAIVKSLVSAHIYVCFNVFNIHSFAVSFSLPSLQAWWWWWCSPWVGSHCPCIRPEKNWEEIGISFLKPSSLLVIETETLLCSLKLLGQLLNCWGTLQGVWKVILLPCNSFCVLVRMVH